MTMPFRFAPGCCDPCGPVCGKAYSPEQFTVVSGTYDTETHILSPGGILEVPYFDPSPYMITAKRYKIEAGRYVYADVDYLYGDYPFFFVKEFATITVSHGTFSCSVKLSYYKNTTASENIGPTTEVDIKPTQEGEYIVSSSYWGSSWSFGTNIFQSQNHPRIKNNGDTGVVVDKIIATIFSDDCEAYRCKEKAFDFIDSVSFSIVGEGPVLRQLTGTHKLQMTDCHNPCTYLKDFSAAETFYAPVWRGKFVHNVDEFAFPSEIEWIPFTLNFTGRISFHPQLTAYQFEPGVYKTGYKFCLAALSEVVSFEDNFVPGIRYVKCSPASNYWKNLDNICTVSRGLAGCSDCTGIYCWPTSQYYDANYHLNTFCANASFGLDSCTKYFPYGFCNKTNIGISSQTFFDPVDIDLALGVSTNKTISIIPSSYGHTHFQVRYNGSPVVNGTDGTEFTTNENSGWVGTVATDNHPDGEPCVESYKHCPYVHGITIHSQGGNFIPYFTGKTISAEITEVTHVL